MKPQKNQKPFYFFLFALLTVFLLSMSLRLAWRHVNAADEPPLPAKAQYHQTLPDSLRAM